MRLDGQVLFGGERAQGAHEVACAAGGEARREDRRDEGAVGVDLLAVRQALLCAVEALRRVCVAVRGRVGPRRGIHAASPDEGTLAVLEAEVCEEIGRFDVDGGVVRGRCGAVGERALDHAGIDGVGLGERGE